MKATTRFTKHDFESCLFYAASGTDLQPLLRYSNLTQTFLYVCVGTDINQGSVLRSIREKLANLDQAYGNVLRLQDVVSGMQMEDFDYSWPVDWRNYLPTSELQRYRETFGRFQGDDNWAISLKFSRHLGNCIRNLRLVVLNGEALATYAALSHEGSIAPRIFCSIQTGMLEYAQGMMGRILGRNQAQPALWIRGLWHDPNRDPIYRDDRAQGVLCKRGLFPVPVQSYTNWNSRMGSVALPRCCGCENPWSNDSLVKTYASKALHLKSAATLGNSHRHVRVLNRRLKAQDSLQYDRVFAPRNLCNKYSRNEMRLHPLSAGRGYMTNCGEVLGPTPTLTEALSQIEDYVAANPGCKVGLIGCGFEDEGICLEEWASTPGPDCQIDVFAPEPLDYADLRGWTNN